MPSPLGNRGKGRLVLLRGERLIPVADHQRKPRRRGVYLAFRRYELACVAGSPSGPSSAESRHRYWMIGR